jgi:hypothetical protein
MKISVTNLTLNPLSTDVGLVAVGGTTTVSDVSPDVAFKVSMSLKALQDAGRVLVSVVDDATRLDTLEPALMGADFTIQALTTVIPSAQVLALNATPATIVPAPGAGKMLVFESCLISLPAGTAYAGIAAGEDLAIKYTGVSGLQVGSCETIGFLDQVTAQVRMVNKYAAATLVTDFTPVANAPLTLGLLLGEITTGTGNLSVRTYFRVLPSAL